MKAITYPRSSDVPHPEELVAFCVLGTRTSIFCRIRLPTPSDSGRRIPKAKQHFDVKKEKEGARTKQTRTMATFADDRWSGAYAPSFILVSLSRASIGRVRFYFSKTVVWYAALYWFIYMRPSQLCLGVWKRYGGVTRPLSVERKSSIKLGSEMGFFLMVCFVYIVEERGLFDLRCKRYCPVMNTQFSTCLTAMTNLFFN